MENGTNSIRPFLDDKGKIIQIPVRDVKKKPLLAYLAGKFEKEHIYSEKEINVIISEWHTFNDYFILRRLLVDYQFIERTPDGAQYWVRKKII